MPENAEYDIHSLKDRLLSYGEREKYIDSQLDRLESLEKKLSNMGGSNLTGMPKSESAFGDRISDLLSQKIDLENEVKRLLQMQKKERAEVYRILEHIRSSDERSVICVRYIDCLHWNDVNVSLFGNRVDFLEKEDSYLRRTFKIHGLALYHMAKILHEESKNGKSEA